MQNPRRKILVLGYGEMGHAMQHLLAAQHDLVIWQRTPRDGSRPVTPESLVAQCQVIIICLPALPHFDLLTRLRPTLSHQTLCLSIAKGLDEQGRTAADVFNQVLGTTVPNGVLYGPMIAEEIRAGKPAFAELALSDNQDWQQAAALFRGSHLHVEPSPDRVGIAWSAVLKNVYAILFGVADELQLGDNMRGHLAVGALREIGTIMTHVGGQATTPYQLAGLGDLITTATSAGSHHHALGRLLVRGQREAVHGEGIHTLQILRSAPWFTSATLPLLHVVDLCVRDPDGIRRNLQDYLAQLDLSA